ncbi:uncharacterized protein LOC144150083 [Haemaphysalis longicornis]
MADDAQPFAPTAFKSRQLFNKRFIAEVRKRPCLWHRDHMNTITSITSTTRFGVRGALEKWDELGAVFGLSGEMVRKRWRYHRDRFTKKWRALFGRRKVDIETARALPADKQWPYFKDLLFVFEEDPLLESDGEEMAEGSTDGDPATPLDKEVTNDTTCSGDSEPAEQAEPSETLDPSSAVEASDAAEVLAENTNNEEANSEPLAESTNNLNTSILDAAVQHFVREEAVLSSGDNAGSLILLQSPIANTVIPTITFAPEVNWSHSGIKRRRLLPKGPVVSDVRSVKDDVSVSNLTNGPSLPVNGPSPPVNGLPLPVIRLSLPANGPSMLVNGLSLPVIRLPQPAIEPLMPVSEPLLPINGPCLTVDGSSMPIDEPSAPIDGSSLSVDGPSPSPNGPLLPINEPSLPAKRPSPPAMPAKRPLQMAKEPSLPITGPSLPVRQPLPQPSAPESNEPVVESSSTEPSEMDHIGHFLCSLERYVRKTAEETQPQLMMELLNVASSYSENLYPVLLFPRT